MWMYQRANFGPRVTESQVTTASIKRILDKSAEGSNCWQSIKDFVNKYHEAWNKDRKEDGLSTEGNFRKTDAKGGGPFARTRTGNCTMWNQEKFNQANGKLQQGLKQMILETQCRMYIRRDTVKALGERFYDCYEIFF